MIIYIYSIYIRTMSIARLELDTNPLVFFLLNVRKKPSTANRPPLKRKPIQKPPGDLRGCGWASSHRDSELPMTRAYLPCGQDFTDMIWIRRFHRFSMREIGKTHRCRFWCQDMFVGWWWQLLCRYLLSSWVVWTLSNLCIWCWVYTVGTRSVLHIRIWIGMWALRTRFYLIFQVLCLYMQKISYINIYSVLTHALTHSHTHMWQESVYVRVNCKYTWTDRVLESRHHKLALPRMSWD